MLAPWKKNYDQPKQHIKKQRHYFVNKVTSSQSCGFSSSHVGMWELDHKESWGIDAFELWCLRRLYRVPWTARRSNQSILKKISLNVHWDDPCWSWNSNTLATWCKELTHWKRSWCWERLKAGGEGDDRGWDGWMASLIQWTWVTQGVGDGQGSLACCSPWGHRVGHDWATELNWTECLLFHWRPKLS